CRLHHRRGPGVACSRLLNWCICRTGSCRRPRRWRSISPRATESHGFRQCLYLQQVEHSPNAVLLDCDRTSDLVETGLYRRLKPLLKQLDVLDQWLSRRLNLFDCLVEGDKALVEDCLELFRVNL